MQHSIPLSTPCLTGREKEYVADAMARRHLSSGGHYSRRCEALLEEELGVPRVLLTTSGTHALEMCAALRPSSGRVIVPTFTFTSTANAFYGRGTISLCDVHPDTLNLDLGSYELSELDGAVIPVHYGGVACDMDSIMKASERWGLTVVEDAAHALFGKYRGKYLGTFGDVSALSFHETKNLQCGEGGALIINDVDLIFKAERMRDKGTNRSAMLRGEVAKYTWVDWGSSYAPSDLLAAFLFAQLESRAKVGRRRRAVWSEYRHWLQGLPGLTVPTIPGDCESAHHVFYLLLPDEGTRDRMITELKSKGIGAAFHFVPLHESPMGRAMGYRFGEFPVAERAAKTLVRLPMYYDMTKLDVERVIDAVREFKV